MKPRRGLSSKLRVLATIAVLAGATTAAALTPSVRAYYTARLAETTAGRFGTLAFSPVVSPATDPLMDAVVQWDRLRRDNGPTNFAEIAAFLRQHRGWPAETMLRRRAEKLIDDTVPFEARFEYFRDFPPLSAMARFRLAEALRARRDLSAATAAARAAWTAGIDDINAEALLQQEFGGALTPADHAVRLDRLLWRGGTTAEATPTRRLGPE